VNYGLFLHSLYIITTECVEQRLFPHSCIYYTPVVFSVMGLQAEEQWLLRQCACVSLCLTLSTYSSSSINTHESVFSVRWIPALSLARCIAQQNAGSAELKKLIKTALLLYSLKLLWWLN